MVNFLKDKNLANFAAVFFLLLFFSKCAVVQDLGGGPKDTTPPKVLMEAPVNKSVNFSGSKIRIHFDNYVTLNNIFKEITISPVLDKLPIVRANKKNVDIEFQQSLEKNTTYVINFGKAIADINEGNVLENYVYAFSTGGQIDTLQITGKVKDAISGQSLKDVLVFIFPANLDSLLGKKKPSISTRTDANGFFKLQHLKQDVYKIYAFKEDKPSGQIFNTEGGEIGFLKDSLVLTKSETNVNLKVFREIPEKLKMKDYTINKDGKVLAIFNKPISDLSIKDPVSNIDKGEMIEFDDRRDSVSIWLADLTFDSLKVVASYKKNDSVTSVIRRNRRDVYVNNLSIFSNLNKGVLKPGNRMILTSSLPIEALNSLKFSLFQDSILVDGWSVSRDLSSSRKCFIDFSWKDKCIYELKLADSALVSIYKSYSKAYAEKFILGNASLYCNLSLNVKVPVSSLPGRYIVQLFNDKEVIVRTDVISNNAVLKYTSYYPGAYSVRVVYDTNGNGIWDTGCLKKELQPEAIWYSTKKIEMRANWELEEILTIPENPDVL